MNALRQFIDVPNKTFQVTLPDNFTSKRIEIIILPSDEEDIPDWHKPIIDSRLVDYKKNPQNVTDCDTFLDELENETL